jgi:hypothetical protein
MREEEALQWSVFRPFCRIFGSSQEVLVLILLGEAPRRREVSEPQK